MSRTTTAPPRIPHIPEGSLAEVSLVYRPPGSGFNKEVKSSLPMEDLVFLTTSLHRRDQARGGLNVDVLGAAARMARTIHISETQRRIDEAVDSSLGWFKWLVPARVQERIATAVMAAVGWAGANLAGELAHKQITMRLADDRYRAAQSQLHKAKFLPAPLLAGRDTSPQVQCQVDVCKTVTPLDGPVEPGWTVDTQGRRFCPTHPAETTCRMCGEARGTGLLICEDCARFRHPAGRDLPAGLTAGLRAVSGDH